MHDQIVIILTQLDTHILVFLHIIYLLLNHRIEQPNSDVFYELVQDFSAFFIDY